MINEHMMDLGSRRSTIRELFEYGNSRADLGRENVFDFSIGNPNVPAPEAVRQGDLRQKRQVIRLHCTAIPQHRAPQAMRGALADSLTKRFGTDSPATACT